MCPDKQLLSAYMDKEIEEPVRRRVTEHLGQCDTCAGVLKSYEQLHSRLLDDTMAFPPFFETRLFEILKEKSVRNPSVRNPSVRYPSVGYVPVWRRKIFVPVPVLAFAMILVMVLAMGITVVSLKNTKGNSIAVNRQEVIPVKLTISDLEELTRLLQSDTYVLEVDMQLPKDHNFSIIGEPVLIRDNGGGVYDLRP